MSDLNTLALQATQYLAPFFPYLIKGGIEAGRSAAGKVGELATEKGWKIVWSVWDKLMKHEDTKKAAETVAKHPDDVDAQTALRSQIKLVLAADTDLAEILEKLIMESGENRKVSVQDNRSVAIGGNASNNVIITGDKNKVKK